jgi:hypothetical protein
VKVLSVGAVTLYIVIIACVTVKCNFLVSVVWYGEVQVVSVGGVTLYIVIIAGGTAQCKFLVSVL